MESSKIPEEKFNDLVKCKNNTKILKQLDAKNGEIIIFSCLCQKKNRFGMSQERTLLLTNQNLYNIEKDKIKRRINFHFIQAFTRSRDAKNHGFIIHVDREYDYTFDSPTKYGI